MKKTTKRLSIQREVLQHLDLRIVAGGITTPSKPDASCSVCTVVMCPKSNGIFICGQTTDCVTAPPG